jgi:polyphosphate kinase
MITHLLASIPYKPVAHPVLTLPDRPPSKGYERPPRESQSYIPDYADALS